MMRALFRTATVMLLTLPLLSQVNTVPTGAATGLVASSSGGPAAGVRVVAIPAGDPNIATGGATVFESLAQTDSSGRYRLDAPPGRYFIAAGAVNAPTFYPGTVNIASAKVIVITAGTIVEGVNFSQFIPAAPAQTQNTVILSSRTVLPPDSTGVLSGVLRYPDGTPASGISVIAVSLPVANVNPAATPPAIPALGLPQIQFQPNTPANAALPLSALRAARIGVQAVTDISGRYRMDGVPPNTYTIMAGYADSPVFYPGVNDSQKATAVITTPTTMLDALNFTVPAPTGTTVHVRVSASAGKPGGGATLILRGLNPPFAGPASPLPQRTFKSTTTAGDGLLDFTNVIPGKYTLQASMFGAAPVTKTFDVARQSIDVDFVFPVKVLTGRILWDDGRPFSDPVMDEVAVSTVSNPNFIASTLFSVANNGMFSAVLESNDYRFFIRNLPDGYVVQSVTSGTNDLTKEILKFNADAPTDVEVRIAKKSNATVNVQGRVMDSITRNKPQADRIQLCCLETGPVDRMSAPLGADGSFEFSGVPPGRYAAELKGKAAPGIANSVLNVPVQGLSGLALASAANFATITASVVSDGSAPLPAGNIVSVTLTPSTGQPFRVTLWGTSNDNLWSPIPIGLQYNVEVSNIPQGYRVKSLGTPDPQTISSVVAVPPNSPPGYAGTFRLSGNSNIRIILTRE